jgi:hypothetical protein
MAKRKAPGARPMDDNNQGPHLKKKKKKSAKKGK